MVMKEVSKRCIRYVQGLDERLKQAVAAWKNKKETKNAGTQTEPSSTEEPRRISVFQRLN